MMSCLTAAPISLEDSLPQNPTNTCPFWWNLPWGNAHPQGGRCQQKLLLRHLLSGPFQLRPCHGAGLQWLCQDCATRVDQGAVFQRRLGDDEVGTEAGFMWARLGWQGAMGWKERRTTWFEVGRCSEKRKHKFKHIQTIEIPFMNGTSLARPELGLSGDWLAVFHLMIWRCTR